MNQVEDKHSESKFHLPPDILIQIISRLPMPSMCLVRCASKAWYNMITDLFSAELLNVKSLPSNLVILGNRCKLGYGFFVPTTWNFFLAEFYVTGNYGRGTNLEVYDLGSEVEYNPVASCNGLVLLMVGLYRLDPITYFVSNPIIGQYMQLPFPEGNDGRRFFSGFGFRPSTNQYKVFQFHSRNDMSTLVEHTLGTSTWTDTQIVVPEHLKNYLWSGNSAGTYLNGALFWMVLGLEDVFIYCFDLETEGFGPIDSPEFKVKEEAFLGATAGGQLYISVNSCGVLDLFVMKDFESKSSWTKVLSLSVPQIDGKLWKRAIEVIHYADDRDVIVLGCYDNVSATFYLVAWKLEADGGRTIVGMKNTRSCYRPIAYIPNFNSLSEAVTGEDYQVNFGDHVTKFVLDS